MVKSVNDIFFDHGGIDAEAREEVYKIWVGAAGLKPEEANRRMGEIILLARHRQAGIIGIATAVKTFVSRLQNNLYTYRCFVVPDFRTPGLETLMIVKAKEILAQQAHQDGDKPCVGIVVVVQNELLKRHWRQAVWPGSEMLYIGDSPEGHHVRVGYFKGAKI